MLYHIEGLCPRTDIQMNRCNFGIKLWPSWRDWVKHWSDKNDIDQSRINIGVSNLHRAWLDGCGYSEIYDPDNCGFDRDKKKKPGPNARPLYGENAIRIQWGDWGPEHITVPGNACGLDIDSGVGAPRNGRVLLPHNIDTISQQHLLLVAFTWIADCVIVEMECED